MMVLARNTTPAVVQKSCPGGAPFPTSMSPSLSAVRPVKLSGNNSDKSSVLLQPTCPHASRHKILSS